MIAALAIVVFAQTTISITSGKPSPKDSARRAREGARMDTVLARRDSTRSARDSVREQRRRAAVIPLTPALEATAFRDPGARALLMRARAARLAQDSTLTSYDATAYERISAGMKIGSWGRERLLFRSEKASRVRWQRGKGAVVDITGARAAVPMFKGADIDDDGPDADSPIPYFPGQETLWIGSELAKADVGESSLIHPLAAGAEAYYTYASGDSASFQLPGGRRVVVRELRVTPRKPSWNVAVGSLWFDAGTGQLVRGVFRMAEPMNIFAVAKQEDGEDPEKDIPIWLRPLMTPMVASVDVITVDYGLFNGRYWLPRSQTAEGKARVGAMRVPFELGQRFDYNDVNSTMDLPPVELTEADTAHTVAAHEARRLARHDACNDRDSDSTAERTVAQRRFDGALRVLVRIPCDTAKLAHSPTLPRSIYDTPDTLFADADVDALVASALSLRRQGEIAPEPPQLHYGLAYTRYNRIEGFSTAAEVTEDLGAGYNARALFRLGTDLSPDGELALSRSNGRETYTLGAYRRLNSANDWSNPFSLGASLTALLFGHDDAVYYRTAGVELTHQQDAGWFDTWRLFAEQEFDASVHSRFSFSGRLKGNHFPDNIDATNGNVVGLALRSHKSFGEDPDGFRALSDVRIEGAAGTFDYTRGMLDVTMMHPLGGPLSGALTLGGGMTGGAVPTQRLFYIGGMSTVRGQDVGVEVGDAYWNTRAEIGIGNVLAKPVIFGDLGWAGDRRHLTEGVVPVSGAGVGASFFDGLLRIDVAKGIRPSNGVRASMYVDARF